MYIAGDFSVIDNTLFAMSNANDGGAIYLSSNAQNAILTNVSIDKASATNGGGIYVQALNTKISNSSIKNSIASDNGGGIYWKAGAGILEYTNIEGNTAKTRVFCRCLRQYQHGYRPFLL